MLNFIREIFKALEEPKFNREELLNIYDEVRPLCDNNRAAVCKNGKWGFVDNRGELVIPLLYKKVTDFKYNMAIAHRDHKTAVRIIPYGVVIDKWGEPLSWYCQNIRSGLIKDSNGVIYFIYNDYEGDDRKVYLNKDGLFTNGYTIWDPKTDRSTHREITYWDK